MRPAVASSLLSLATVGLLAGCPDRSISKVDPAQGRVEAKDIPVNINRDVDLLFVIDDSPSMADKQSNLAANFKKFIDVLDSIPGGRPNVHIAVVTSDVGTHGADGVNAAGIGTLGQGGCSGAGKAGNMQLFGAPVTGGPFISDTQPLTGPRNRNYNDPAQDGTGLTPAFEIMAKGAGAGGCGFEQHLEAMRLALQRDNPINQTFLRDDAYLAVIFIADEDDCSMASGVAGKTLLGAEGGALGPQQSFRCTRFGVTCDDNGESSDDMNEVGPKGKCHPNESSEYLTKVEDYVNFLKNLKSDPNKVIVAGIMGTTTPVATELRAPPRTNTRIPALAHSCTYEGRTGTEVADPPIRLQFFLDQFPNRSTFASICQPDLSGGLQQIGDLLKTVIGDPCIQGTLSVVGGTQAQPEYDCSVSTVTPGTGERLLAKCPANGGGATDPTCWHIVADAEACKTTAQHLKLKIERQDSLPKDTHILGSCVTEVTDN